MAEYSEDQQPAEEPKKLSIPEFAAKIKAKFPDYKDIEDGVLVDKILKKYPEYQAEVQTTPPAPAPQVAPAAQPTQPAQSGFKDSNVFGRRRIVPGSPAYDDTVKTMQDRSILKPKFAPALNKAEDALHTKLGGKIAPPEQSKELEKNIVLERNNPAIQYEASDAYLSNMGLKPGEDITAFYQKKKEELQQQRAVIKKNLDDYYLQHSSGHSVRREENIKQYEAYQQQLDDIDEEQAVLEKYAGLANSKKVVAKMPMPKTEAEIPAYLQSIGANVANLQSPGALQRHEEDNKNVPWGPGSEVADVRKYQYEAAGISAKRTDLIARMNNKEIDPAQFQTEMATLDKFESTSLDRHQGAKMKVYGQALGQIVDEERGQSSVNTIWQNVFRATPTKAEAQKAINTLKERGANFSKKEEEYFLNNPGEIQGTAILPSYILKAADGFNKMSAPLARALGSETPESESYGKEVMGKVMAVNPDKQFEQPETIIDVNKGDNFLKPIENEKAGQLNWGYGTGQGVAGAMATVTNFIVGNKGVGALAKAAGMGTTAAHITSNIASNVSLTYDDGVEFAKTFTKNQAEQRAYALIIGTLGGLLFANLDPEGLIKKAFFTKSAAKYFASLIPKEGVQAMTPELVGNFVYNTAKNAIANNLSASTILTANELKDVAVEALFNPQTASEHQFDIAKTFAHNAIMFGPLSILHGRGVAKEAKNRAEAINSAFEASKDVYAFKTDLEAAVQSGKISPEDAAAKLDVVTKIAEIRNSKDLPATLPPDRQAEYAVNLLNEKQAEQQISELTDKVQIEPIKEEVKVLQEERRQMLQPGAPKVEPAKEPTTEDISQLNEIHKSLTNEYMQKHSELLKKGLRGAELENNPELVAIKSRMDKIEKYFEQPKSEKKPTRKEEPVSAVSSEVQTDADIEKRMAEIEDAKTGTPERDEFNSLEKEMEKRERDSIFNVPLENVSAAIDVLVRKEKYKPNGYGAFIEKRDARETKEVADKYLKPATITDAELKRDFSDAVRGNPTTWYADGLKMRESLKEATSRGIDTEKMLEAVTKVYTDAGYGLSTAKSVVGNMLKPVFEGSTENKPIQNEPVQPETPKAKPDEAIIKEIKSLGLTHVENTGMGAKQAEGMYLSTESGNRYSTKDKAAKKAKVNIENPRLTDYVENAKLQQEKLWQLLNENKIEFKDIPFEYTKDVQKFADTKEPSNEQVSQWYKSVQGDKINEDYFEQSARTKAAKLVTEDYQKQGYDALYFRESDTQEGELIVFDRNKVTVADKPIKEKGLMKKARELEIDTTFAPRDIVLKHFADGGKINTAVIEELYGGKSEAIRQNASTEGERKARFPLLNKNAKGIDELAHQMWEEGNQRLDHDNPYTTQDYREAIESVLKDHVSAPGMAKELVDRYGSGIEKNLTEAESEVIGNEMLKAVENEVEKIPENIQKELISLLERYNEQGVINWDKMEEDSNGFDPEFLNLTPEATTYIDKLLKEKLHGQAESEYVVDKNESSPNNEGQGSTGQPETAGSEIKPEAPKPGEGQSSIQDKINSFKAEYDKAVRKLEAVQEKLSKEQSTQTDIFGNATAQKGMFEQNDAKDILDPLKAKVKEAKAALDKATKDAGVEADSDNPDLFEEPAKKRFYEEVAGAKPINVTGRISTDPIVGGKPKNLSKILREFAKKVNQKIFYAKVSRGAAGTYTPSNAAIKLRYSGDLDTTSHEFGHKLDDVHHIADAIMANPTAAKELPYFMNSPAASKPPKGHPNPDRYKRAEGVAEWVRAFIVNPQKAIVEAPEIHKIYQDRVDAATKKAVEELSIDIRTWAGASGRDKTLANIEIKPEDKSVWQKLFGHDEAGKFYLNWTDRFAANFLQPMQAFNKAFKFSKGIRGVDEVLPENDPIILSRLLLGYNGKFDDIVNNGMVDAKLNRLQDKNGKAKNVKWLLEPLDNTDTGSIMRDMEDTLAYMVSERAVELAKRFNRADVLTGTGGGILKDLDVATKTLEEFDNGDPKRLARIKEASTRYRELADDVLQYMVAKGRIADRVEDKDGNLIGGYQFIKQNNIQYVAMNRIFEAEPGVEIDMGLKGGGGKALGSVKQPIFAIKGSSKEIANPYSVLLENMNKSIKEADRNEVMRTFRDMIMEQRQMNQGDVKAYSDIGFLGKEGDKNSQKIFVDGKAETWVFHPEIHRAIKNLDGDLWNLPGIMRMPGQLLRFTVTHFPTFAARNIVRDTQDRLIKSTTGSGLKDFVGNKAHWQDVAKAGGLNAGFYFRDRSHYYGLLETTMDEIAKNKKFILLDPVRLKDVWHGYENLLYKSETANRVAEYRGGIREAKAKGMDDYNAMLYGAYKARDLIDFAVAGHTMRMVNQLIPFTNAAVQGMRSTAVSIGKNPAGFALRTALYSMLPAAGLWYLNHRDKETADEYEEIPAYQRDMYWNYKLGPNKWLSIPKPYELSLAAAGMDRVLSDVAYKREGAYKGYAGTVAKSFMPFDEAAAAGFLRPIVENIANYDFYREKTIIPAHEANLALELRHTETASRLGQLTQQAAGIDARKVDHFIRGQFSYFGNTAMKLSDIGNKESNETFDITDLGFFKHSPAYNSESVQELVKFAKEWNMERSRDYKAFSDMAGQYFDLKDDAEKEKAGKQLTDYARSLLLAWKKANMQQFQIDRKKQKDESR